MPGSDAGGIEHLDAFETVWVANRFMEIVRTAGIGFPGDDDMPSGLGAACARLRPLIDDEATCEAPLPPEVALDVARVALPIVDADPVLSPLLAQAIEEQARDDSMDAVEILALGAAASLVLAVATTEFEWKAGRLRSVRKRALSDQAVIALASLLERVGPGSGRRGGLRRSDPERDANADKPTDGPSRSPLNRHGKSTPM